MTSYDVCIPEMHNEGVMRIRILPCLARKKKHTQNDDYNYVWHSGGKGKILSKKFNPFPTIPDHTCSGKNALKKQKTLYKVLAPSIITSI